MNNKNKHLTVVIYLLLCFCIINFSISIYSIVKFSDKQSTKKVYYNKKTNIKLKPYLKKIYNSTGMIKRYQNKSLVEFGSGFAYKKDDKYAYLLTNEHVVKDDKIVGVLLPGKEEIKGEVLGRDNLLDIAVVRIDNKYIDIVADLHLKNDLELGSTVYAIGSPVSEDYFNSVTEGVISGVDRKLKVSNEWIQKSIQTDAAINAGNSGGPLINEKGEVIGINSIKLSKAGIEGLGFAIRIIDVYNHLPTLEKGLSIERPRLGVLTIDVNDKININFNKIIVSPEIKEGVVVIDVVKDSTAEKNGIKKGDIIVKINNEPILNLAYLKYLLYNYKQGDEVIFEIMRNNKRVNIKFIL